MIVRRSREFTVNMGNYESVKLGASAEIDTANTGETQAVDGIEVPVVYTPEEAFGKLDKLIEEALAPDIKEASELTTTRDSFVLSWKVK